MKSDGYSLIEMMIALLLSTVLMTAFLQFYTDCKKEFIRIDELINRKLALMDLQLQLRDAIQKQGFTPCLSLKHLQLSDHRYHPQHTEHPDGLKIQRMSEYFSRIDKKRTPFELILESDGITYEQGDAVLIADCTHAEIHSVSKSDKYHLSLNEPLGSTFRAPFFCGAWIDESFYVKKNNKGQSVLNYDYKHPEVLNTSVRSLSVVQSDGFFQVHLGLDDGTSLDIETGSRQP